MCLFSVDIITGALKCVANRLSLLQIDTHISFFSRTIKNHAVDTICVIFIFQEIISSFHLQSKMLVSVHGARASRHRNKMYVHTSAFTRPYIYQCRDRSFFNNVKLVIICINILELHFVEFYQEKL